MKLETKLKHTPAPWSIALDETATEENRDTYLHITAQHRKQDVDVCKVCDPWTWSRNGLDRYSTHDVRPVREANARLIAAAPELLDALMQATILLKHACDGHALESQYAEETADAMTAALTKAIGEDQ